MQRAGAGIRSLNRPSIPRPISSRSSSRFSGWRQSSNGGERPARGRADAQAKGVKFGRKATLTPHQQKEARARIAAGETQRSVARSYNVSQSTISRLPS
jgi:hypothetical protein